MGFLKTIGLIGIGYAINEHRRTKPIRYRTNFSIPSYSEYFHELIVNKLDILFYGGEIHARKKIPYRTTEYFPANYSKYLRNKYCTPTLDNLSFKTKSEAYKVLDGMHDILEKFGSVSISDYYDLASYEGTYPRNNNFGWYDLHNAEVLKNPSGDWYIDLEEPESI